MEDYFDFILQNNFLSWKNQITESVRSDSKHQKIWMLIEFVFAASFTQRHPTAFCSQLFCAWKCQGATQAAIHHRDDGAWRWRIQGWSLVLKRFLPFEAEAHVSRVWWDLLINSKLQCSVTMFSLLLGDAVFLPLGAVDFVWWPEMSDLRWHLAKCLQGAKPCQQPRAWTWKQMLSHLSLEMTAAWLTPWL